MPDQSDKETKRLYEAGWSGGWIAEQQDISPTLVYRRLKRMGVKIRPSRIHKGGRIEHRKVQEVLTLYRAGYSSVEIGKLLGIAHNTVTYRLKLAGEPRRPRGESTRLVFARRRAA